MLIDSRYLQYCADKVREIVADYEAAFPECREEFPRNTILLHHVIHGRCEKLIYQREMDAIEASRSAVRSMYVPYDERVEIYYVLGLDASQLRFYQSKELFQIHLSRDDLVTRDPADLVSNMIARSSPQSVDLDLGHATISETIGDIAAMEFLFPLLKRKEFLAGREGKNGVSKLAAVYGIPRFVIQRSLNDLPVLEEFFGAPK